MSDEYVKLHKRDFDELCLQLKVYKARHKELLEEIKQWKTEVARLSVWENKDAN